jgi:hypothetical protein
MLLIKEGLEQEMRKGVVKMRGKYIWEEEEEVVMWQMIVFL